MSSKQVLHQVIGINLLKTHGDGHITNVAIQFVILDALIVKLATLLRIRRRENQKAETKHNIRLTSYPR